MVAIDDEDLDLMADQLFDSSKKTQLRPNTPVGAVVDIASQK
jgi:hypothetical protein